MRQPPSAQHRPNDRSLRRLAASIAGVSLILATASVGLLGYDIARGWIALDAAQTLLAVVIFALAFPIVGWVVLRRWPGNRVGWIYLAIGFWQALNLFSSQYSNLAFEVASGNLPFASELSWIAVWAWTPGFTLFCTVGVLLFPDGLLPSRRWRPVVALAVVALALVSVPMAVASWPYRGEVLEAAAASPQGNLPNDAGLNAAQALSLIGQLLLLVAMLGSVAGLATRFRRSAGIERQQLKWFTFGAAVDLPVLVIWTLGVLDPLTAALSAVVFALALPIAISIAILRHGLYDIDRIISRTLVYGTLGVLLALAYGSSVLVLSAILAPLTAENSLTVAGSTLVVVALFAPVRRRIQAVVDRRFYRSRYDTTRELAELSQRLRAEVDLDGVQAEILRTLTRTLQPATASVWLRAGRSSAEVADRR